MPVAPKAKRSIETGSLPGDKGAGYMQRDRSRSLSSVDYSDLVWESLTCSLNFLPPYLALLVLLFYLCYKFSKRTFLSLTL